MVKDIGGNGTCSSVEDICGLVHNAKGGSDKALGTAVLVSCKTSKPWLPVPETRTEERAVQVTDAMVPPSNDARHVTGGRFAGIAFDVADRVDVRGSGWLDWVKMRYRD